MISKQTAVWIIIGGRLMYVWLYLRLFFFLFYNLLYHFFFMFIFCWINESSRGASTEGARSNIYLVSQAPDEKLFLPLLVPPRMLDRPAVTKSCLNPQRILYPESILLSNNPASRLTLWGSNHGSSSGCSLMMQATTLMSVSRINFVWYKVTPAISHDAE